MAVYEMLLKNRTYGDYYTHVCMGEEKENQGKYVFDRSMLDAFYESYSNELKTHDFYIAETLQTYFPVLVDIDIKLPLGDERRYTEYQLECVIRDYQEVLKSILDNVNDKHLICFVLEKPAYNTEKNTKNGFHLHFPYVFLSKNDHLTHLLPRVKKMVDKSKTFESFGFEKSGDLIDKQYTVNPWLLYGSKKSEGKQPYTLTKIYNHNLDIISLSEALCDYKLYDGNEDLINIKGNEEHYLPRILSVVPWCREPCELKTNLASVVKLNVKLPNYNKVLEIEGDGEEKIEITDERKDGLMERLKLVKCDRFKKFDEWFKLMCLMKGNGLKLKDFLQMSKDSGYEQYNEDKCSEDWYSLQLKDITMGFPTVHNWLTEDGVNWKSLFCKKKDKMIASLLDAYYKTGAITDLALSEIFYENYKDNLIYTQIGWLHFDEKNGWRNGTETDIIYPLMKCVGERFLNYTVSLKKKDDEDEKAFAKKVMALKKESIRLCSTSVCQKIIKTCQSLFFDANALTSFDEKPSWFCFSNMKAIDIHTKNVIDIKATDRILTTCGYPMPERKDEDIIKVVNLLKTIMPSENMTSFLSALSLFIYGNNINEKFIVFRGEGRNGKGLSISLLERVMGKYFYALPTEVLTEHSKGAGRANPEIMACQFARCVIASEPDQQALIVKTTINLLTGNDTISARQLHKEQISFKPKFTLGLMCNDLPNISGGINDAIKNRLEIQTFPYTFKPQDELDEENPKHKLIDTSLKEKLKNDISFRNGLLYLLIDTWIANKGKYITCQASKEEQQEYARANNPLSAFLDSYEKSENFIRIGDLFKTYCNQSSETLSKTKFRNFLEQAGIKVVEDSKHGHKVFVKIIA